jgi:beta-ureidopropionase
MKATCALVQMNLSEVIEENIDRGCDLIREAGAAAQVICLPELATSQYFCYEMNRDFMALAEPVDGPSVTKIAAVAREADAWVVMPFYEKSKEDGQLYNSAAVIDRRGEVQGLYRKNVIPLMKFEGVNGCEKFYFRPGNLGYPVFETDFGITIGITICYERHFPEGPRALALAGADVIFVPTATPAGKHMWEVELRAMAIANLLWVGGVNRVGNDRGQAVSDMDFYGGSLFTGPDGVVTARAGTDGDEIVYSEIDTGLSHKLREDWGFFRDRRPEIYGALTTP